MEDIPDRLDSDTVKDIAQRSKALVNELGAVIDRHILNSDPSWGFHIAMLATSVAFKKAADVMTALGVDQSVAIQALLDATKAATLPGSNPRDVGVIIERAFAGTEQRFATVVDREGTIMKDRVN